MDSWTIDLKKNFSCTSPVFIEGLPGIGNVGKIVVDYLIEQFDAKKIGSLFSYDLPNNVFVNEKNLVDLPSIELFHFTKDDVDYVLMTGDAQPTRERSSYELCAAILDLLKPWNVSSIITLGGIGLNEVPENPAVFVTGTNKSFIKEFVKFGADDKVYGVVGPIIGVSGLLVGLAKQYKIPSCALLGETFGHPMYIGLKEARSILLLLDQKYSFGLDFSELDDEIDLVEKEVDDAEPVISRPLSKKTSKKLQKVLKYKELQYIG